MPVSVCEHAPSETAATATNARKTLVVLDFDGAVASSRTLPDSSLYRTSKSAWVRESVVDLLHWLGQQPNVVLRWTTTSQELFAETRRARFGPLFADAALGDGQRADVADRIVEMAAGYGHVVVADPHRDVTTAVQIRLHERVTALTTDPETGLTDHQIATIRRAVVLAR